MTLKRKYNQVLVETGTLVRHRKYNRENKPFLEKNNILNASETIKQPLFIWFKK